MSQNATAVRLGKGIAEVGRDLDSGSQSQAPRGTLSLSPISGRKFRVPDSLYNLYMDSADGKPYYHRMPLCPADRLVIKGVSVEKVWEFGFNLEEILRWYRKRRPRRVAEEFRI